MATQAMPGRKRRVVEVVATVVRRNTGEKSSPKLGRFSVPSSFFRFQTPDSGTIPAHAKNPLEGYSPDDLIG